MFMLTATTVLLLLGLYTWWRGFVPVLPSGRSRQIAALCLALGLTAYPFIWFFRHMGLENSPTDMLSWFGGMTFGFVTICVVLLLLRDAGLLLTLPWRRHNRPDSFAPSAQMAYTDETSLQETAKDRPASAAPADRKSRKNKTAKTDLGRRAAIRATLDVSVLAATGGLSAAGLYMARKTPDVRAVTVPVKGLHPGLDGLHIAQLSDIHIGPTVKRDWVEKITERTATLNADIIAITGDLVDGSVDRLNHDAAPLASLQAPLGKYFVTGNHEYYSGVFAWLAEVEKLGYRPLVNEHLMVERGGARLAVAGVTDFAAGSRLPGHATDPAKALADTKDADYRLMLAHQPKSVYGCAENGADLILSGHTHGGQYWPYTEAIHWFQPYVAGLYDHDGSYIYVSRGTGYWGPPIRLGASSEITLLTLRRA